MMATEDVVEILAIDLIGVVPDDESIVTTANRGEVAVMDRGSKAGRAFASIARRLLGEDVPLQLVATEESFLSRLWVAMGLRPRRASR
jgi:septum site-determining protein MinD